MRPSIRRMIAAVAALAFVFGNPSQVVLAQRSGPAHSSWTETAPTGGQAGGAATVGRSPVAMDLSSTAATMAAPVAVNQTPVNIQVGAATQTISGGQMLTPAQYMAVQQVLRTGVQNIVVGSNGNAVGGSAVIGRSLSEAISSLIVPQGVTVINRVASLNLSGDLTNAGNLYVMTRNSAVTTANITALNIFNQQGALLTTVLPSTLLPGMSGALATLNLNLTAVNNIVNAGTISSSGSLTMTAGGSIVNALPAGATGPSPVMQALNNVNLNASNIVNSGLIAAATGNINIASQLSQQSASQALQSLNVNNAGGTLQALQGAINAGSMLAGSNINLTGGNWLSNELNVEAGAGTVDINVGNVTGLVNVNAGCVHVTADTANLRVGTMNITGDPTFYNSGGSVTLGSLSFPGEDLAIVASEDVIVTGDLDTSPGMTVNGDITIIAGANFNPIPPSPDNPPFGPDSSNTITIDGPSSTGGSVQITGNITTNGGNLVVVAYDGTPAGSSFLPGTIGISGTVNTGTNSDSVFEPANLFNGNVTMIAGATSGTGISTGAIITSGTSINQVAGTITLLTATPVIAGGSTLSITNGTPTPNPPYETTGLTYTGAGITTGDLLSAGQGGINSNSNFDGGDAGPITIIAGGDITTGALRAFGGGGAASSSAPASGNGGDGAPIYIQSMNGAITINGDANTSGGGGAGAGPFPGISVQTPGTGGNAGSIDMVASGTVTISGPVLAAGGGDGGTSTSAFNLTSGGGGGSFGGGGGGGSSALIPGGGGGGFTGGGGGGGGIAGSSLYPGGGGGGGGFAIGGGGGGAAYGDGAFGPGGGGGGGYGQGGGGGGTSDPSNSETGQGGGGGAGGSAGGNGPTGSSFGGNQPSGGITAGGGIGESTLASAEYSFASGDGGNGGGSGSGSGAGGTGSSINSGAGGVFGVGGSASTFGFASAGNNVGDGAGGAVNISGSTVHLNGTVATLSTTLGSPGFAASPYAGDSVNAQGPGGSITITSTTQPTIAPTYFQDANYAEGATAQQVFFSEIVGVETAGALTAGTGTGTPIDINHRTYASPVAAGSFFSPVVITESSNPVSVFSGDFVTPAELIAMIQVTNGSFTQTLDLSAPAVTEEPGTGYASGGNFSIDDVNVPSGDFTNLVLPASVTADVSVMDLIYSGSVQIDGTINMSASSIPAIKGSSTMTIGSTGSVHFTSVTDSGFLISTGAFESTGSISSISDVVIGGFSTITVNDQISANVVGLTAHNDDNITITAADSLTFTGHWDTNTAGTTTISTTNAGGTITFQDSIVQFNGGGIVNIQAPNVHFAYSSSFPSLLFTGGPAVTFDSGASAADVDMTITLPANSTGFIDFSFGTGETLNFSPTGNGKLTFVSDGLGFANAQLSITGANLVINDTNKITLDSTARVESDRAIIINMNVAPGTTPGLENNGILVSTMSGNATTPGNPPAAILVQNTLGDLFLEGNGEFWQEGTVGGDTIFNAAGKITFADGTAYNMHTPNGGGNVGFFTPQLEVDGSGNVLATLIANGPNAFVLNSAFVCTLCPLTFRNGPSATTSTLALYGAPVSTGTTVGATYNPVSDIEVGPNFTFTSDNAITLNSTPTLPATSSYVKVLGQVSSVSAFFTGSVVIQSSFNLAVFGYGSIQSDTSISILTMGAGKTLTFGDESGVDATNLNLITDESVNIRTPNLALVVAAPQSDLFLNVLGTAQLTIDSGDSAANVDMTITLPAGFLNNNIGVMPGGSITIAPTGTGSLTFANSEGLSPSQPGQVSFNGADLHINVSNTGNAVTLNPLTAVASDSNIVIDMDVLPEDGTPTFTNNGSLGTSGDGATISISNSLGNLNLAGAGLFNQAGATPGDISFNANGTLTFLDALNYLMTSTALADVVFFASQYEVNGSTAAPAVATINSFSINSFTFRSNMVCTLCPVSFQVSGAATSGELALNGTLVMTGIDTGPTYNPVSDITVGPNFILSSDTEITLNTTPTLPQTSTTVTIDGIVRNTATCGCITVQGLGDMTLVGTGKFETDPSGELDIFAVNSITIANGLAPTALRNRGGFALISAPQITVDEGASFRSNFDMEINTNNLVINGTLRVTNGSELAILPEPGGNLSISGTGRLSGGSSGFLNIGFSGCGCEATALNITISGSPTLRGFPQIDTMDGGTVTISPLANVVSEDPTGIFTSNFVIQGTLTAPGVAVADVADTMSGLKISGGGTINASCGCFGTVFATGGGPLEFNSDLTINSPFTEMLDDGGFGIIFASGVKVFSTGGIGISSPYVVNRGTVTAAGPFIPAPEAGIAFADGGEPVAFGMEINGPGSFIALTNSIIFMQEFNSITFNGEVNLNAVAVGPHAAVEIYDTPNLGVIVTTGSSLNVTGGNGQIFVQSPEGAPQVAVSGLGTISGSQVVIIATDSGSAINLSGFPTLTFGSPLFLSAPDGSVNILQGSIAHAAGVIFNAPGSIPAGFVPTTGIAQLNPTIPSPSSAGAALLIVTDPLIVEGTLKGIPAPSGGGGVTGSAAGGTSSSGFSFNFLPNFNNQGLLDSQLATRLPTDYTPYGLSADEENLYGQVNGNPPPYQVDGHPLSGWLASTDPWGNQIWACPGCLSSVHPSGNSGNSTTQNGARVIQHVSKTMDGKSSDRLLIADASTSSTGTAGATGTQPSSDGKGFEYYSLLKGMALFNTNGDMVVGTVEGDVHIEKGSMAFVYETGNDVSVYNLHDRHDGAIAVTVGKTIVQVPPGKQLVLTKRQDADFTQVNPGTKISYRNPQALTLPGGVKGFIADFSIPSAIYGIPPLKKMMTSPIPAERKVVAKLLKNAVIMADVFGVMGPYQGTKQ